jgi:hypothetical protein
MAHIDKPGASLTTQATWFEPIIRRDTNTAIINLTTTEVLELIGGLVRDLEGRDDVRLVIEADNIYAKDME